MHSEKVLSWLDIKFETFKVTGIMKSQCPVSKHHVTQMSMDCKVTDGQMMCQICYP